MYKITPPKGCHHVLSTASGLFVAPLGPSGILIADPRSQPSQECKVFRPKFGAVNFYKISPLARVGDGEILVCAARNQGLFVLTIGGQIEAASSYQRPGLDIVDVCSLSTPHRPFAAAALSREGEIYLFDDVRSDPEPVVFAGGPGDETFYSILRSKDELFALTSRALYAFPGLALGSLDPSSAPTETPFSRMPIDAVEMYLVHDRLFILLTDRLFEVSLDSLVGTTRTSIPIITPPPTIWGSSRPDEWSTSKQPLRAVA